MFLKKQKLKPNILEKCKEQTGFAILGKPPPEILLYDKYRGDQSIMTVNNPNRAIQQVLIDY